MDTLTLNEKPLSVQYAFAPHADIMTIIKTDSAERIEKFNFTRAIELCNHIGVVTQPKELWVLTNAEKQARFRSKSKLINRKDEAIRDCLEAVISMKGDTTVTGSDVRRMLEEVADVPNGWTEEDLDRAYVRVDRERRRLLSLISHGAPAPKFGSKVHSLADHLISALNISGLSEKEQAEAILTVAHTLGERFVRLDRNADGKSSAMAFCIEGDAQYKSAEDAETNSHRAPNDVGEVV